MPCWASPDLHLIPAGERLDPDRAVVGPAVGGEYTVAVDLRGLGRAPADGVVVRAWWVEPGWFDGTPDPAYRQHLIGGTFRDRGDGYGLVAVPTPWRVPDLRGAHAGLVAVVEAFADPRGRRPPDRYRHVVRRNLTSIRGGTDTGEVLDLLDLVSPPGHRVQVRTGGLRRSDRGPFTLGPSTGVADLVRTDAGWRVRGGGPSAPSLVDLVATVLGASGTTASALLSGTVLGGARSAAVHLTTATSGYSILLTVT